MIRQLKTLLSGQFPDLTREYHAYRFARALRKHPMQRTSLGFQFSGSDIMQSGAFEPEETRLLQRLAPDTDVYIDVGANIGYFVCLMRFLGKRVVAIEPLQKNIEYLFSNLRANHWMDVEVLPLGIGASTQIVPLYGGGTGASLLERWAGASNSMHSMIAVNTLNNLIGARFSKQRTLIKVDVEGAELGVLRGATHLLAQQLKPRWLMEVCLTENHPQGLNPDYVEVFEFMFRYGYRAYSVEAGMKPVMLSDVTKWFSTRVREFGYVSFYFEAGE